MVPDSKLLAVSEIGPLFDIEVLATVGFIFPEYMGAKPSPECLGTSADDRDCGFWQETAD